jgi:large subunit ribosomal protein L3
MAALIGKKIGMSQIFNDAGLALPVTVIEAGPCPVVQIKTAETDGYSAVQLGFGAQKASRATKAESGHATKAGLEASPSTLSEFAIDDGVDFELGQQLTVEVFEPGDRVKVTGTTKGRGFQGVVKRYNFAGRPASHGHPMSRTPGSMGPGTDPSRVIKGKKLPGRMGGKRQTIRNLEIVQVDAERNLLFVRGAVPGSRGSVVFITK